MVHRAATTHWLEEACGSKTYFLLKEQSNKSESWPIIPDTDKWKQMMGLRLLWEGLAFRSVQLHPHELSFPAHKCHHLGEALLTSSIPKHQRQTCRRDHFNALLWLCHSYLQKPPMAPHGLLDENQAPWSAIDIIILVLFSNHRLSKFNSAHLNFIVSVDYL